MNESNIITAKNDFSLIIFGASGHLASLKIFPALYFLALKNRFPKNFAIIGFARSDLDDASFRERFAQAIRKHVAQVNERVLSGLVENVHYHRGQYDSEEDFKALAERLNTIEKRYGDEAVRLAYFSIPPTSFGDVAMNLCKGGVHCQRSLDSAALSSSSSRSGAKAKNREGERPRSRRASFRCIVEKPLGHDEKSADAIRKSLTHCFQPEEIYLLDHYLGKEAARNIYYLRLVNPIVERILKHTVITNVQITAMETAGLEGRAGYFEQVGTLRDMFQSHMMQMMALVTMNLVERSKLPQARLKALKNIYLPPAKNLDDIVMQAQYAASGEQPAYRNEEGVATDSRTPTYAALKLMTRTERWQGVPFYLRSGKCLAKKETRIAFEFQNPYASTYDVGANRLEMILQGEAGMKIHLQTKMGGSEPQFRPLVLEDPLVCVGDCLDEHGLLLLEAINGKQDWFLDFEEVMTQWKLIDPLQVHLDAPETSLSFYPCGSDGPEEAEKWIGGSGYEWV